MIIPCISLFLPKSTFADTELKYKLIEPFPFVDETTKFPQYLEGIFKFAIATVSIAALLMIVIGGYLYIVSGGNQAKNGHAKEIIWNALLGLVVVMFIGIIFYTINSDIMTFKPLFPTKIQGTSYEQTGTAK